MKFIKHEQYYFGTLLKQIDVFAFPRTGSHYLTYCVSGLFDSVSMLPEIHRTQPEAVSRQDEIREEVLYGLDLREQAAPFQPVWLNPLTNGVHGQPIKTGNPTLLLIRHPLATAYSYWRARQRLHFQLETPADLNVLWDRYEAFYDAGLKLLEPAGGTTVLIRYEDLVGTSQTLQQIVAFVGLRPKLAPEFVHWITRFNNFAREGERTFYRGGDNDAWRENMEWVKLVTGAGPRRDFSRFGYTMPEDQQKPMNKA